jgi:uracil-DNA glycosylase
MDATEQIEQLHQRINACTVCAGHVAEFAKPTGMRRGQPGRIMVIGQGPGQKELETSSAFAGQSGKKLNEWLIASGTRPDTPREGVYLTSVIKCCGAETDFEKMARNCRPLLFQQITIIRPTVIITLGAPAYNHLRMIDASYDEALCKIYSTETHALVTPAGLHYWHLPWPHPSGLNRWHNEPANRSLLTDSFVALRKLLNRE